MPPQNPVDRTIVDVSALGVKLAYPMLHLVYALLATASDRDTSASAIAIAFMAQAEMLSDQIVTRAQGKQEDSRALQGT